MPIVRYMIKDGSSRDITTDGRTSVMMAAIRNGIPGIDAECGGSLDCATCHIYVADEDFQHLPAPSDEENELLGSVAAPRKPTSRLGCQVVVPADKTLLTVIVPGRQS